MRTNQSQTTKFHFDQRKDLTMTSTSKIEETCRDLYECISRIRKAGKHRKLTAELQELLGDHLYQLENLNKHLQERIEEAEGRVEIYGDAHRYQVKLTHEACMRERVLFDDLFETRRKLAQAESYKQDCIDAEAASDRLCERVQQQKGLITAQRQAIADLYMSRRTLVSQVEQLSHELDVLKMANEAAGEELRSSRPTMINGEQLPSGAKALTDSSGRITGYVTDLRN